MSAKNDAAIGEISNAALPLQHLITGLHLLQQLLLCLHVALGIQSAQQIRRTGECMSGLHGKVIESVC